MSRDGKYTAYFESQYLSRKYDEVGEGDPNPYFSAREEAVRMSLKKYAAMSPEERRAVKNRVLIRAFLSAAGAVLSLYIGLHTDNPFLAVAGIFLSFGMMLAAIYHIGVHLDLRRTDMKLTEKRSGPSGGDPMARLMEDFRESERKESYRNHERAEEPFRRA